MLVSIYDGLCFLVEIYGCSAELSQLCVCACLAQCIIHGLMGLVSAPSPFTIFPWAQGCIKKISLWLSRVKIISPQILRRAFHLGLGHMEVEKDKDSGSGFIWACNLQYWASYTFRRQGKPPCRSFLCRTMGSWNWVTPLTLLTPLMSSLLASLASYISGPPFTLSTDALLIISIIGNDHHNAVAARSCRWRYAMHPSKPCRRPCTWEEKGARERELSQIVEERE